MSADDYRAGYEAGYMRGRVDQMQSTDYDDRTPLTRARGDEEALNDGTAPDPR